MNTKDSAGPSATGERRASPSGSPLVGCADIDRTAAITRSLLGYGVLAGPFYLVVGLAQALTRDGYDLTRHDLSLLANGPLGWIQIANLVLSGLMTVAAGIGMRRALRALGGDRGAVWGPRLVVGYGLGLVGAGIFVADPMNGFPRGIPEGPPVTITVGGIGHLVFGALGFLCLIVGCLLFGRYYAGRRRASMAWFSRATGVVYLVAFVGIASGSASAVVVLGFWAAVVLAWGWLAAAAIDLYRRTPLLTPGAAC